MMKNICCQLLMHAGRPVLRFIGLRGSVTHLFFTANFIFYIAMLEGECWDFGGLASMQHVAKHSIFS